MKIFKVGDKSKGICSKCKELVPTTFEICSAPLQSGRVHVDDVLAAKCDYCDHIVSIPQQSAPRIKEALNTKKHSIEVRLPRHLLDILFVASDKFGIGNPDSLKDSLIRYYISRAQSDKDLLKSLKMLSTSELGQGVATYRLSLKVNQAIFDRFEQIMKATSLNKTQLIKSLILKINDDVLQRPVEKRLNEIESVLLATG